MDLTHARFYVPESMLIFRNSSGAMDSFTASFFLKSEARRVAGLTITDRDHFDSDIGSQVYTKE